MGKKKSTHRKFDLEFKLSVLKEYYESGSSKGFIARKYEIDHSYLTRWERDLELNEKDLTLSSELCSKLESMQKSKKQSETSNVPLSREQELEAEIRRLRQALEYSELRNEALHEVIKIGREQYGIDLLKKAGAKQ